MTQLGSDNQPGPATQMYGFNVTNQFASALTLPSGGPWKITSIGCWLAGYGGSSTYALCLWDSSMNLDRQGPTGSIGSQPMGSYGATKVTANITDIEVAGGTTVWVGFWRHSDHETWFPHTGSGTRRQKTTGDSPVSLSGYSGATGNLGVWLEYVAANSEPTAPTLTGPANGSRVLTTQPKLDWSHNDPDGDPQDKRYIEIDNGSGFGSPFVHQATDSDTYYNVTGGAGLNRGNRYYWHVRTADAANGYGPYSSTRWFEINALPTATHVSPANNGLAVVHNLGSDLNVWTAGGAHAKPKLDWDFNDSDGDSQAAYEVEIWSALSGGTRYYTSGIVTSSTTNHLAEWAGILGTQYFWTVRVKDSAGEWGSFSTRTAFKMRWSQAIYDYAVPGGAASSAWQFASTGVVNTVNFLFRTATGAGGTGTLSAWKSSISTLVPAAYLNVMVRMNTKTVGSPAVLGTMTFSYIAAAQVPDRWVVSHAADWSLDPGVRRYGAKSLHAAIKTASGDRYIYPFQKTAGDDVSVSPNTEYTLSAYISTGLLPVAADISLRVFPPGLLTNELTDLYLDDLTLPVDVPLLPGGPTRNDRTRNTALLDPVSGLPQYPEGWRRLTLRFRTAEQDRIRPVILYGGAGGTITINDTFWVDAVQLEESRMAMPWAPGLVGEPSVTDVQGLVVDEQAGGILRLRDAAGTTVDLARVVAGVQWVGGAARVERDAPLTIANTTVVEVNFNSQEQNDPNDDIAVGTPAQGNFTANRAGWYQINAGASWTASDVGRREIYIRKNGSTIAGQTGTPTLYASVVYRQTISTLVKLVVGDYISIHVRHTHGTNLQLLGEPNTFFTMQRVTS